MNFLINHVSIIIIKTFALLLIFIFLINLIEVHIFIKDLQFIIVIQILFLHVNL